MGVPKQHHTKSSRNQRRMHIFIKAPSLAKCPKCGKEVPQHTLCWNCGYYKGEEVFDVIGKLSRKEKKRREKEIKDQGKDSGKKEKELSLEGLSKK